MKKKNLLWSLIAFACLGVFVSCSDDDEPNGGTEGETTDTWKYVIAASGAEAIYLIETDNISEGTVDTKVGDHVEVEAATAWLFPKNKYAYRLVYAQGNAGTGSSYKLNANGNIEERNIAFSITSRFTTYGIYGDYIICAASGVTDKYDPEDTNKSYPLYGVTFTYLNTEQQTLQTKTVLTEDLLGTGERYTVSGIVESNGKFYTALCSEGHSAYGVWKNLDAITARLNAAGEDPSTIITQEEGVYKSIGSTMYPNQVSVAIYEGTSFENPTIITDDRLSTATSRYRSQFYSMIDTDDDGNVYVFSANNAGAGTGVYKSDKTSGALRIKAGTNVFDRDYFCDITQISGGHSVFKVWHISGDYFLLQMFGESGYFSSGMNQNTNRLAILKASTKEFRWVTGMPADNIISNFGSAPYFEDGKAYMPVVFKGESEGADAADPAIYVINPSTAIATKGLTVKANNGVSAIGKLYNY